MSPNLSPAVLASRVEPADSLDDFPTPSWAARAWCEHVAGKDAVVDKTCWEPAANRGHMIRGLQDYFSRVHGSDIFDYGAGFPVWDFLSPHSMYDEHRPDWIVTNPPFRLLRDFVQTALPIARVGVAMLVRLQCLEGIGRFNELFAPYADRYAVSAFVERVSLVHGCLDPKASRPTAYCWLTIWKEAQTPEFLLSRRHIPPCRAALERASDYPTTEPEPRAAGGATQDQALLVGVPATGPVVPTLPLQVAQ